MADLAARFPAGGGAGQGGRQGGNLAGGGEAGGAGGGAAPALAACLSLLLAILLAACLCALAWLSAARALVGGGARVAAASLDVAGLAEGFGAVALVREEVDGFLRANGIPGSADEEAVRSFLNNPAVAALAQEAVQGYVDALARGDLGYHVQAAGVMAAIRAGGQALQDAAGFPLTERVYAAIEEYLNGAAGLSRYTAGELLRPLGVPAWLAAAPFANEARAVLAILCALFALDLFWANARRARRAVAYCGAATAVAGALAASPALLLGEALAFLPRGWSQLAFALAGGAASAAASYGLAMLAAGGAALATAAVIRAARGPAPGAGATAPTLGRSPGPARAPRHAAARALAALFVNAAALAGCAALFLNLVRRLRGQA
jgi:hypothetical protein